MFEIYESEKKENRLMGMGIVGVEELIIKKRKRKVI